MLKGKTKSGFSYNIDERKLKDFRMVKAIADVESPDAGIQIRGMVDLANWLLGDRVEALEDHVRKNNEGFASVELVYAEVFEIINSQNKLKN